MHELMLIPVSSIMLPRRKHAAIASVTAQSISVPTSSTAAALPHVFVDLTSEDSTPIFTAFELDLLDGGDA